MSYSRLPSTDTGGAMCLTMPAVTSGGRKTFPEPPNPLIGGGLPGLP